MCVCIFCMGGCVCVRGVCVCIFCMGGCVRGGGVFVYVLEVMKTMVNEVL